MEDVKRLVTEVITMGQNAFADFEREVEAPDTYQQWHFKGYIVGAVALEVILAIFTGGCQPGGQGAGQDRQVLPEADAGPEQTVGPGQEAARRTGQGPRGRMVMANVTATETMRT